MTREQHIRTLRDTGTTIIAHDITRYGDSSSLHKESQAPDDDTTRHDDTDHVKKTDRTVTRLVELRGATSSLD